MDTKKLVENRATEIELTNRIDKAIANLPYKVIPKVDKVGTVFIVDKNSFNARY